MRVVDGVPLITVSMAACSLMPATSAPCHCRFTWMPEMWLSAMVENAAPRWPTMPACSQSRIVLRRTV